MVEIGIATIIMAVEEVDSVLAVDLILEVVFVFTLGFILFLVAFCSMIFAFL